MLSRPESMSLAIQSIQVQNLLSFGRMPEPLLLRRLNILIGPNGSGKSNLLEAFSLLRSSPGDLRGAVRRGGGAKEWVWKGAQDAIASLDLVASNGHFRPLRHSISFWGDAHGFSISDESIENAERLSEEQRDVYFYYRYRRGNPILNVSKKAGLKGSGGRALDRDSVQPDQSILSQRRDPDRYPELASLAALYERMRLYREWSFGRNTVFREPQRADMRNDRLEEDFSNLGLFLNRLRRTPRAKAAILNGLRDLYDVVTDFDVIVEGGTVQVFFTEGEFVIPATRLSDGTLRFLCLLAILCDPDPPPFICIEEPELGLHPDVLPKLADLLKDASQRTQLVITTHSDILVDAMTEDPESIIICEKHDGQTQLTRLNAEALRGWLNEYQLGELWTRGQLGGTRW